MTEFDVPRLVPADTGAVSVSRREELVELAARERAEKHRLRRSVKASDVLGLPVVVLDPGVVFDDEVAASWKAGRFVFTPCQPFRRRLDFTLEQKAQMVGIYRSLPYGAKTTWLIRHGLYSARMHRWGQLLGLPTHAQQAHQSVAPDIDGPLTRESMAHLAYWYTGLPYGEKQAFLAEHGLGHVNIQRWISTIADGSFPSRTRSRKAAPVNRKNPDDLDGTRETVAKILAENERLKKELDKANRKIDRQVKEIDKWEKTSDVLGKALASMPDLPGVDYDAEENPYPKTKNAAMKLADKKNNTS